MNMLSHVAIIMDGNGRWANKKKKPRKFGHLEGTKNIKKIIPYFIKRKIPYLTLFAFGLDNWSRPKSETSYLLFLFEDFLKKNLSFLLDNNVKIKFVGEKVGLSKKIKILIKKVENLTEKKKALILTVAFNYSSKNELVNAFKKIVKKKNKKISVKIVENFLYTKDIPDPDILIRTGAQRRISNFLLWQLSYTEIFFINKLWPDFNTNDLKKIFLKYKKIIRNFGSI